MEESKAKTNFFKKVWYSITKFEKYPEMATEGTGRAIKYLAILVLIITAFAAIGSVKKIHQMMNDLSSYIENNIPEFKYADNKMTIESEEPIIITNINYDAINKIVIDPSSETDEQKAEMEAKNEITGTTVFLYKDQIAIKIKSEDGQTARQEYLYSDYLKNYINTENLKEFNKKDFVEYMRSSNMNSYYYRYTATAIVYLYVSNLLVALSYCIELGVLGWITTKTTRIKMKFSALFNMSAYALTLPIILQCIYLIINLFTTFIISYFQIAFITIAYIYLAAAIFMLKDDFIKKQQEVSKIEEEQEKVKEEIRQQEEKTKKEDTENKKKKDNDKDEEENENKTNEEEPKGSEA